MSEHTSKGKMNGIHKYLSLKGFHEAKHIKIINNYLTEFGASNVEMKGTFRQKSKIIQQDFGRFVSYIRTIKV